MKREGGELMVVVPESNQSQLIGFHDTNPFREALYVWLQGKPANTRRSYMRGILDFYWYFGEFTPMKVEPQHVANYKEHLKNLGRADSTVAQRLAALSSYYNHLILSGLTERNPVDMAGRDDIRVSPYGRSRKMAAADFRKLMAAIDTTTESGAMYHTLFLWYYLAGHRRSEPLRVTGSDIRRDGGRITYRTETKGGHVRWRELPPPVWMAIQHYLELAGRQLADNEPIFQATRDNAKYLHPAMVDEPRPLSDSAASQALKRYAAKAGLNPEKISLHSLRHLGAMSYYKASGNDVEATRQFLGHSNLATTTIYVSQLEGQEHKHWQAMVNLVDAATD